LRDDAAYIIPKKVKRKVIKLAQDTRYLSRFSWSSGFGFFLKKENAEVFFGQK